MSLIRILSSKVHLAIPSLICPPFLFGWLPISSFATCRLKDNLAQNREQNHQYSIIPEWQLTYLLDLPPNPTDCSNCRTFKPSNFKIWSKHILDKCCFLEYLAHITNQFKFLHYPSSVIKLKNNCSCGNPKSSLKSYTTFQSLSRIITGKQN